MYIRNTIYIHTHKQYTCINIYRNISFARNIAHVYNGQYNAHNDTKQIIYNTSFYAQHVHNILYQTYTKLTYFKLQSWVWSRKKFARKLLRFHRGQPAEKDATSVLLASRRMLRFLLLGLFPDDFPRIVNIKRILFLQKGTRRASRLQCIPEAAAFFFPSLRCICFLWRIHARDLSFVLPRKHQQPHFLKSWAIVECNDESV